LVTNFDQYFRLKLRNYSYLTTNSGVGNQVPQEFIKKPDEGWTSSDGMNWY
jgi:hypothetical protein